MVEFLLNKGANVNAVDTPGFTNAPDLWLRDGDVIEMPDKT